MNNLTTVIYYSSNRENPEFEKKIQQDLLKKIGDMPVISITQKPVNLGINLCIGEKVRCDHNLYRQVQIGCKIATTPFVIMAESDTIYPEDYFKFLPPDKDMFYRYSNIWILYKRYNYFFQKNCSESAMIVGRKYFIDYIDKILDGRGFWKKKEESRKMKHLFREGEYKLYGDWSKPVVNFKTGNSMRPYTTTVTNSSDIDVLPYWGSVAKLKEEYNL